MAVGAEHRLSESRHPRAHLPEHRAIFIRDGIPDRVRQVDDSCARFDGGFNDFAEVGNVGP